MAKLHKVSLGGETFHAQSGQLLLDAALISGVDLPHDCRAGRCGSCVTRVCQGITLGGESRQAGTVHACQARVFSDLALEIEPLPPVQSIRGRLVRLVELTDDIVEVTIAPERKLEILPGQYCRFSFKGFPARPFSPTARLTSITEDGRIRLNIKRVRNGRVTPLLGSAIHSRHPVTIEGPFGHAFLRPGKTNRLVLIGSGTGFAPVWAVAAAALRENPRRDIVLLGASRKLAGSYMVPALALADAYSHVTALAAVEELKTDSRNLRAGRVIDHLPALTADDLVYAAGAPVMVDAINALCEKADATMYADPFEPMAAPTTGWLDVARGWLKAG